MILLLLACSEAPPPKPEPKPQPIVSKPFPVVVPGAKPGEPVPEGGPVPIELQFVGVGGLHQGYFADSEIVTVLATELGPCLTERAVVRVSYDSERHTGRIRVFTDPKTLTCKPEKIAETVDLSPLQPVGQALANYRDTLASRFDFRIASFRIDLEALSGTNLCRLDLSGQFPPDGTTWSPCVSLGGERVCNGKASDGVKKLSLSPGKHTDYLAACFR